MTLANSGDTCLGAKRPVPAWSTDGAAVHDHRRFVALDACTGIIISAAWMLNQVNAGLKGDAGIYMGRALADADPGHVGRDLMFVLDGQSAFTIFRPLARAGVLHFGLETTTLAITLLNIAAWALACWALVRSFDMARGFAVVLAAALLLPRNYTPWGLISAGEALAIPRPLAEALVMFGLAALAKDRRLLCVGLFCCAAAVHPIMALPGFAVLAALVCLEHRRWLVAPAIGAAALAVAGLCGAPLASRLFQQVDPVWLAILQQRNSYLFLTSWPLETLCSTLLQIVTILIASCLLAARLRLMLRIIVVVALGSLVLTVLFCDIFHSLLMLQIQPWRALWLVAAVAPACAGVCVWQLLFRGAKERIVAAALVAGWACHHMAEVGGLIALVAAALFFAPSLNLTRRMSLAIYAIIAAIFFIAVALNIRLLTGYVAAKPSDMPASLLMVWALTLPALPVIAFTYAVAIRWRPALLSIVAPCLVLVGLGLVATRWDDRPSYKRDADAGRVKPDLVARLASRPGEVLWLGGDELWYWARRPNWNVRLQGAGLVFSRKLAIIWHDRATAMLDSRLADETLLEPRKPDAANAIVTYDRARLEAFCRHADAPAWIVYPLLDGAQADPGVDVWTSPFDERRLIVEGNDLVVRSYARRALVPCAPARAPGRDGPH